MPTKKQKKMLLESVEETPEVSTETETEDSSELSDEAIDEILDSMSDEELVALSAELDADDDDEQLDEISKATLGSYINKAKDKIGIHGTEIQHARDVDDKVSHFLNTNDFKWGTKENIRDIANKENRPKLHTAQRKYMNKVVGVRRAVDRLMKEESADGTGGVPDSASKTNALSIAMKKLAGLSFDQIAFFNQSLDQVGHEGDPAPDAASKNADSIKMKGTPGSISDMHESLSAVLKEDLANVFGDNKELTEEFKDKITTLFESAVGYRVTAIEQELIESYDAVLEESIKDITEDLVSRVDDYISYVADTWLKENEVAIIPALRTEITEEFISDLGRLFEAHNFRIPTEEVEVVEELAAKNQELETALNEEISKNMALIESLKEATKEELVRDFSEGLTLSQAEKFKALTESIEYDGNDEAFLKKLEVVKNAHFVSPAKKVPNTNIITEEIEYSSLDDLNQKTQVLDPVMKNYVSAISRTIKV